jgi:hypothetical protein
VTSRAVTIFIYVDAEHISWRRIARLKPQPYPLILSMKKLFMPCFWLARSANIKEMHKPRQEADPLF